MKRTSLQPFLNFLSALLLCLGVLTFSVPFLLFFGLHTHHALHIWILSGPAPFSHLGGGPMQLWLGVAGLLFGTLLLVAGGLLRWWWRRMR